jgi:hypothetical protein
MTRERLSWKRSNTSLSQQFDCGATRNNEGGEVHEEDPGVDAPQCIITLAQLARASSQQRPKSPPLRGLFVSVSSPEWYSNTSRVKSAPPTPESADATR